MNIGESSVNPVVAHRQLFVVDSKLVHNGSMDVVATGRVVSLGWSKSPLVALAVCDTSPDAAAGQPIGEDERIVIPPLAALGARHPSELGRP